MAHRDKFTRLVTARTRLCLEGFPRSGNTFAFQCVTRGLGVPVADLAHHLHSVTNVRRAIARKIPTFRRPRACCSSLVVLGVAPTLADAYRGYRAYYEAVLPLLRDVTLVPFEDLVAQPEIFTDAVARCLNIPGIDPASLSSVRETLEAEEASKLHRGKRPVHSAQYPRAAKNQMKDAVLGGSGSPETHMLAEVCNALHDRVLAAAPRRVGDLR